LALELILDRLTAPVDLLSSPDRTGRRFVIEQTGVVHVLDERGRRAEPPFLDIRDRMLPLSGGFEERGLLGFAFHPAFNVNGRFFVTYSAPLRAAGPSGWNCTRRVSEFMAAADAPDRADPLSGRVILELDWPSRKHNGGGLAFGPDGYLYVGMVDGGGVHGLGPETLFEAFDVPERLGEWDRLAQDVRSLYGKILRLDVNGGYPGYAVPELNPFARGTGRPEVYAWGFRNPYRFSIDRRGGRNLVGIGLPRQPARQFRLAGPRSYPLLRPPPAASPTRHLSGDRPARRAVY
jgi:glucose/arabinose dehydrogenase